jgi:hypothetical protein
MARALDGGMARLARGGPKCALVEKWDNRYTAGMGFHLDDHWLAQGQTPRDCVVVRRVEFSRALQGQTRDTASKHFTP